MHAVYMAIRLMIICFCRGPTHLVVRRQFTLDVTSVMKYYRNSSLSLEATAIIIKEGGAEDVAEVTGGEDAGEAGGDITELHCSLFFLFAIIL